MGLVLVAWLLQTLFLLDILWGLCDPEKRGSREQA